MSQEEANTVIHEGEIADRMHDLLNLFSGLYDWHDFGDGPVLHIRNQERADGVIADTAALLSVSKDDALHILLTKADHKTFHGENGFVFTFDANKLPSKTIA